MSPEEVQGLLGLVTSTSTLLTYDCVGEVPGPELNPDVT